MLLVLAMCGRGARALGSIVLMSTPYTGASERSWAGAQMKWSTAQGEAANDLSRHLTKRNAGHCHTELIKLSRSIAMRLLVCKTTDDLYTEQYARHERRYARHAASCRVLDARIPVLPFMSQIRACDEVLSGRVSTRCDGTAIGPGNDAFRGKRHDNSRILSESSASRRCGAGPAVHRPRNL
jgi:hypothetical protein